MSVFLLTGAVFLLALIVPSRLSDVSKEECDAYNFAKRYSA